MLAFIGHARDLRHGHDQQGLGPQVVLWRLAVADGRLREGNSGCDFRLLPLQDVNQQLQQAHHDCLFLL